MPSRQYSNTATATFLLVGITDVATSLIVNSASGYPVAPFTIRCDAEIILVGTKTGTTFSDLTRGYDGTTAVAHSLGAVIEHRAIADDFKFRFLDSVADKTATHSASDHFDNFEIDAAWSEITPSGTAVWTENRDALSVKFKNQSSNDCAALMKSLGALSYPLVVTTAIRSLGVPNYTWAGLCFSDGVTSASNAIWAIVYTDAAYGFVHSFYTGTFTNMNSIIITERRPKLISGWLYQRFIWRATNLWSYEISPDGVSWTDFGNGNESFALTPTHFGVGVSSWGGTIDQIATFEYFDVTDVLP